MHALRCVRGVKLVLVDGLMVSCLRLSRLKLDVEMIALSVKLMSSQSRLDSAAGDDRRPLSVKYASTCRLTTYSSLARSLPVIRRFTVSHRLTRFLRVNLSSVPISDSSWVSQSFTDITALQASRTIHSRSKTKLHCMIVHVLNNKRSVAERPRDTSSHWMSLSHSMSLEITPFDRSHTNSCILAFYGPILCHFRDKAILVENRDVFHAHPAFDALGIPSEYCYNVWYRLEKN